MAKEYKKNGEYLYNPITAAKDLGYSQEIIEALKQAKTEEEKNRIMATAGSWLFIFYKRRNSLW